MSPYLAMLGARMRALMQYRAAAAAGLATQLFWGFIRVMIFTAFYRSSSAPQPISLRDMVTYLWLTQAMFALALTNADSDVREMIRSGTVAYELVRPVDLYGLWYSRSLAARIAPTLLRAVPLFVFAALFLGLRMPPSFASFFAWALATVFAVLLAAAISTLVTISLLYTISGEGITRLTPILVYSLSGILIPLPFLPSWMQPLLAFLPFRGIADTPYRLYLGQIPATHAVPVLAQQLVWIVTLMVLGRIVLTRASHRLVVQGG